MTTAQTPIDRLTQDDVPLAAFEARGRDLVDEREPDSYDIDRAQDRYEAQFGWD